MSLEKLRFKYSWRNYQQAFLDGFQEHIKDGHLHVIAPPGSGKTILGLELLIRIGKPTLVLAPTLNIRNQWADRLLQFFGADGNFKDLSFDIKKPKTVTFSTYQSLYALSTTFDKNSESGFLHYIDKYSIETLILDEAHHLKNAWWQALMQLKQLNGLTVVSLTATPPYDSTALELNRYFELCGPIDDEIAVPDLIRNGDLCPHQDYVYFSRPEEAQIRYIVSYREQILNFTNALLANTDFQALLTGLNFYKHPEAHLENIYQNPSFFSSVLIYLYACGHKIDKKCLAVLGFENQKETFPGFTYEWAETLLQHVLILDRLDFEQDEHVLEPISKALKRIGVFEKNRINFIGDEVLYRNLSTSPSKLESIADIVKHTCKRQSQKTRIVILADYIRKEYLGPETNDFQSLRKLGVIPIFKYLLWQKERIGSLGVLTGSLIILDAIALHELRTQFSGDAFNAMAIPGCEGYSAIEVSSSFKNTITSAVTGLFEQGVITILIGTKAFLGEGWDAPAIKTLILASYVGSFVSSNQMRGRAIRVNANNHDKTAAIWHLACLDPTVTNGGKDMEKLRQRFNAFSGVSLLGTPFIENGIERLVLPVEYAADLELEPINNQMLQWSEEEDVLSQRWNIAIENGAVLVRELKIPYTSKTTFRKQKRLTALNASKYIMLQVASGISFFIPEFLIKNFGALFGAGTIRLLYLFAAGLMLSFAPRTFKALKLYLLFGNQYKKTIRIAKALLAYLVTVEEISPNITDTALHFEQLEQGTFAIYLKDVSQHDGNVFVSLLQEVIAPVDNPRYLLVSSNWIKRKIGYRTYYVVPNNIGKTKVEALRFQSFWNAHVDGSRILFTRSLSGRRALLKARFSYLKYQFEEIPKKAITWK